MPSAPPGVLVRPDSLVASVDDGSVITFDRAGRLYAAWLDERFYRRGVDGCVVEKYTEDGETIRQRLDPAPARALVERALATAARVPGIEEHRILTDLAADAARYREVYSGPIPILPPDLYRALVVQATCGCAYNACAFCHLFDDQPFHPRSESEFEHHVGQVVDFFGAGITMRRGVFLGDADALFVETKQLIHFIEVARELPPAKEGVFCFGALFGEPDRTKYEWEAIARAGLKRVYLGIETGHADLRKKLNKPGRNIDALRLIHALKEAGIHVGMVILLGAGGNRFAKEHVRDSAALVRAAFLDQDDIVYLSPLVTKEGRIAVKTFKRQEAAMRAAIGEGPRVAIYDIRAFIY